MLLVGHDQGDKISGANQNYLKLAPHVVMALRGGGTASSGAPEEMAGSRSLGVLLWVWTIVKSFRMGNGLSATSIWRSGSLSGEVTGAIPGNQLRKLVESRKRVALLTDEARVSSCFRQPVVPWELRLRANRSTPTFNVPTPGSIGDTGSLAV